jgi:flagellar biosynthesis/type III secretory pathway chaperone
MDTSWEAEVAGMLTELSAVQDELLSVLNRKRELIVASDLEGMQQLQEREQQLAARLQACHDRRSEVLQRAKQSGLPGDSIRSLTAALPAKGRKELTAQVEQAAQQAKFVQHHSLTNWVLVQRTLLHLSQMLEIIATGGRSRPTYGNNAAVVASGSLVDRAA